MPNSMKREAIICISSDSTVESSDDTESEVEEEDEESCEEDEEEEEYEEEDEDEESAGTSGGVPRCKGMAKNKGHARKSNTLCKEDFDYYNEVKNIIDSDENLDILNVEQCKAYLRRYSLRLTGSKATLIQRIQEHIELKDGNAMNKYPASTFTINCTGDVCTGDVVLFKQRVNMRSSGSASQLVGHRVVAGRIVKESYGTRKQQHTFTVEVLWCRGSKQLPLMYCLIIKGRNLYRHRTSRQPWPNEPDRMRILEEKHSRGKIARDARVERLFRKKKSWNHKERARKLTSARANVERCQSSSGCTTEECALDIAACSAGILIGKQGRTIRAITNASGAMIHVREHESNSALRVVRLKGTPDQIHSAVKLVRKTIGGKRVSS